MAASDHNSTRTLRRGVVAAWFLLMLAYGSVATYLNANSPRPRTLEEKVNKSKAVLLVSITETVPAFTNRTINPVFPHTNNLANPIVCKATVHQVLKGPTNLTEVEFRTLRFHGSFVGNPEDLIGRQCFVFLEERPIGQPPPTLWLSHPAKLLANDYTEYRFSNGRFITERYSHSNYVAAIRALGRR